MAAYGIKKFGWVKQRSAYQDMVYHRARRAEFAKQDQANMESINSAMSAALQNRISQAADLAGQAALKRVQAAAKAKIEETNKQIDAAQSLIDKTKTTTSTSSGGSSSVVDTTA